MTKKTKKSEPIISCSITQLTELICNNFCESDGSPLNPNTISTYLSPSKPDSRPKSGNELHLD